VGLERGSEVKQVARQLTAFL
jgi:hypothetical protein